MRRCWTLVLHEIHECLSPSPLPSASDAQDGHREAAPESSNDYRLAAPCPRQVSQRRQAASEVEHNQIHVSSQNEDEAAKHEVDGVQVQIQ
ncbi:hypothetical protein F2P81_015825 [Scophthalmus maximus]|uniref:Uncharacterized protein n=1 Tax=Scophthalmus maximus TaxID=52904 RepID=A0A6A4SHB2_SCOMX|nr:hypothetical protein F2P81_015825 [Scophthalmus maximus]